MASEVTVGGNSYIIGKLNAFQQFDMLRRLGGVSFWFEQDLEPDHAAAARWVAALATGAMATIPQADADFILQTSLSVVRRRGVNGAAPAAIQVGGRMMFEDIDLETMLELSDHALQESLGPFFEKRRQARIAAATADTGEQAGANRSA